MDTAEGFMKDAALYSIDNAVSKLKVVVKALEEKVATLNDRTPNEMFQASHKVSEATIKLMDTYKSL